MDPITGAVIGSGLSILSDISNNKSIAKTASAQYGANKLFIERDQSIQNEQLSVAADEVNNEIGMALTALGFEARQAAAKTTATQAETNIYGNTAARQQAMVSMKEALAADSMSQAAEAKMTNVQTKFTEVKYQTEAKHTENAQNYNNMMAQQKSTFDIVMGAAQSGMQGYSMGQSMTASSNTIALQKQQASAMGMTL